jgi:hypothetical protein
MTQFWHNLASNFRQAALTNIRRPVDHTSTMTVTHGSRAWFFALLPVPNLSMVGYLFGRPEEVSVT